MKFLYLLVIIFLCAAQTFGSPQQNPLLPAIQACIDAITEHQRLNTLMKGELIKGLLPQSSVRADYTVQRVQGEYLAFTFFFSKLLSAEPFVELNFVTCNDKIEYLGVGISTNITCMILSQCRTC